MRLSLDTAGALVLAGWLLPLHAPAEILISPDARPAENGYSFAHPTFRSVVFISSEARQAAILPPSPVFIQTPPLLWRAPSPFPVFPPASLALTLNSSSRPSNRDVTTYHLMRAHAFGQRLYYRDTLTSLGGNSPLFFWNWAGVPAYPPTPAGSTHPTNRDNTTYHLERSHRFSSDGYKRP